MGLSEKPRNSPYIFLRQLAAEMPVGVTEYKYTCPFCTGGANGDRGFAITRVSDSEARYCCHRATCGKAGSVACWGFRLEPEMGLSTSQPTRKFTPRLYTGSSRELDSEWGKEILDLYGLREDETNWADWRVDTESHRLLCQVLSPNGALRGYELRNSKISLRQGGPKTIHYRHSSEVWLGWYRRTQTGPVILVEDSISALKASRFFQAGCLLGSHVSLEHILEAIEVAKEEKIYLALDKDATDKTIHFSKKWRFIATNLVPYPLSKDLKYMTDGEIAMILR